MVASLGVSTCRNVWEDECYPFSVKFSISETNLKIKIKDNFDQELWDGIYKVNV